jgi:hypothetical protein
MIAQCRALIFAPEQPASLQFGDDLVCEVLQAGRHPGEHHIEAIRPEVVEPFFHLVRNALRRTDEGQPRIAAGTRGQITDAEIVGSGHFQNALL